MKIIFNGGFIVDIDHYYQCIDITSSAHRHQKFAPQAWHDPLNLANREYEVLIIFLVRIWYQYELLIQSKRFSSLGADFTVVHIGMVSPQACTATVSAVISFTI